MVKSSACALCDLVVAVSGALLCLGVVDEDRRPGTGGLRERNLCLARAERFVEIEAVWLLCL